VKRGVSDSVTIHEVTRPDGTKVLLITKE
jgi:hypothetical protein